MQRLLDNLKHYSQVADPHKFDASLKLQIQKRCSRVTFSQSALHNRTIRKIDNVGSDAGIVGLNKSYLAPVFVNVTACS